MFEQKCEEMFGMLQAPPPDLQRRMMRDAFYQGAIEALFMICEPGGIDQLRKELDAYRLELMQRSN